MIRSHATRQRRADAWGVPLEADPSDWAEQQLLEPLPDEDYPRMGDDMRWIA